MINWAEAPKHPEWETVWISTDDGWGEGWHYYNADTERYCEFGSTLYWPESDAYNDYIVHKREDDVIDEFTPHPLPKEAQISLLLSAAEELKNIVTCYNASLAKHNTFYGLDEPNYHDMQTCQELYNLAMQLKKEHS